MPESATLKEAADLLEAIDPDDATDILAEIPTEDRELILRAMEPEEAAEIARDAKVGYLLYNHIAPPLPLRGMAEAFVGKADTVYTGPIRVGEDGDFISLPAGSKAIEHRKLF